jgi:hypothetical protein
VGLTSQRLRRLLGRRGHESWNADLVVADASVVVRSCFAPVFYEASDHLDSHPRLLLSRRNQFVPK